MLAPHLNPAIDAHLRFRLSLQVSNVKALVESPQSVWMTSYMPSEVHKFRTKFVYGWQVYGTTIENLFRENKVPWSDEDEEKTASGYTRTLTREQQTFWINWMKPPPPPPPPPPIRLPTVLRQLIMEFKPPPDPKPPTPKAPWNVEQKPSVWWMDPRMYGDF